MDFPTYTASSMGCGIRRFTLRCPGFAPQKSGRAYACGPEGTPMSNLIGRVQNILLTPRTEWPVIAAEPDTIGGLYTKYILIVSAIVPIALFLKFSVIGMGIPFVGTYRMAMGSGLGMAVSHYVAGLIGVFLYSLVINLLAPSFGGQKDGVQALKAA